MPSYKAINTRLGQLLDSHNMSSSELARRSKVSKKAMNNYVREIRVMPLEVAYSVSQIFGVSVESLYEWVMDDTKNNKTS